MTDFAVALKCGFFGLSGSATAAEALSAESIALSAIAPRPLPEFCRKSRLETGWRLCDIWPLIAVNKLVGVEQHLTEINKGGTLRWIVVCRHRRWQREFLASHLSLFYKRFLLA